MPPESDLCPVTICSKCRYFSFYFWKTDRHTVSHLTRLSRANRLASPPQGGKQPTGENLRGPVVGPPGSAHNSEPTFFCNHCLAILQTKRQARSAHTHAHDTCYSDSITITVHLMLMHTYALWQRQVKAPSRCSLSLSLSLRSSSRPPNRNKTIVSCWNLCPWNRPYVARLN